MNARFRFMLSMALLTGLTACGGGGDSGSSTPTSSTPPPSTPPTSAVPPPAPPPPDPPASAEFPLRAAYQAYVQTPATWTYGSTSSKGGGMVVITTTAAPVSDVFQGVTGYSVTQTATVLSYATNSPATTTSITYYNANWFPLGSVRVGAEYDVYQSPPFVLPAGAKVGDTASVASINRYSDYTMTQLIGTESVRFVIEADGTSANTAIVNIVSEMHNATNGLLGLEQRRFRIDTSGAFSPVSIQGAGIFLIAHPG